MARLKKSAKKEQITEKKGISKLVKRKEKPEKKEVQKEVRAVVNDPYETLKFVLMTEKCVRLIESQNKLVFIVDRQAGRKEIADAAQSAFNTNIAGITTVIDQRGRKKAFVIFEKPGEAGEIAIRLGII